MTPWLLSRFPQDLPGFISESWAASSVIQPKPGEGLLPAVTPSSPFPPPKPLSASPVSWQIRNQTLVSSLAKSEPPQRRGPGLRKEAKGGRVGGVKRGREPPRQLSAHKGAWRGPLGAA